MSDEPKLPDIETDLEAERQRTADHDRETRAFQEELRKLCNRYWFIGNAEIVGSLEMVKLRAFKAWEIEEGDSSGDDWKKGAPTA